MKIIFTPPPPHLFNVFQQSKGLIDYGSLIRIALQRCKTAREAVRTMGNLVEAYGYYSQGESFSIADSKEVWVMEMIGKGEYELGAVWVARRVPDGHVTAHANQARITTFPRDDPANCLYSADVVSFAKAHGLYPKGGSEEAFSFSDVYAPLTFSGARGCEARAWSFFRSVVGAAELDKYVDYVSGRNLTHRMPWSFVPAQKVSHRDLMRLMKDHYEGTALDFSQDVGAGPFHAPYRWRPMDFKVGSRLYTNERSTSTQQTAWVFVAQVRPNMPESFRALNWFGVDDAACTVFMPMYGAITAVPQSLVIGGKAAIMKFSLDSSFWVFNLVAQMAYDRWDNIYPEVLAKATELQDEFDATARDTDAKLVELAQSGKLADAIAFATNYSVAVGDKTHSTWLAFWKYLVARHVDGLTKTYIPDEQNPKVESPGYGQAWYDRIAKETGDKYLIPPSSLAAGAKPGVRKMPYNKIW